LNVLTCSKGRFAVLVFIAAATYTAMTQTEVIKFYNGEIAYDIQKIPYTNPPLVRLDDILTAIGVAPQNAEEGRIRLSINRRPLVIDLQTNKARYNQKTVNFTIRERNGDRYARVETVCRVFSELLGRDMIYEPTSRSIHLPRSRDLMVNMRTRKVQDGYRLVLTYSHSLSAPTVKPSGRGLLVKIKASPIIWDDGGFESNEALAGVDLYENLPDGTTEVLFRMGPNATRYRAEPFTPENPRTVIKIEGDFQAEEITEASAGTPEETRIRRIVIDAGHGGKDNGAVGPTGLKEKDVNLALAKMLAKILDDEGYETRLTRKDDTLLSLKTRTGIANQFRADLFISIHNNAIKTQNATGSETFYLSMDADESFDHSHYDDFVEEEETGPADPLAEIDDELSLMLWDMAQTKYVEDSFRVARYIQQELNQLAGIRNRGVKQAPLKVLKGATMPAILIEAAFISNKTEEKKLREDGFRRKIVRAIANAVRLYNEDVMRRAQREEILLEEAGDQ
jgi:N-acetylmuramoyl-L-alanine amidase